MELQETVLPTPPTFVGRVLNIVKDPKELSVPCEPFDFSNPPLDPVELAQDLVATMHRHSGIGLAANQVGVPYRVFAMRGQPNYCMFNPKIVSMSETTTTMEEACLSFPGLVVKIKRPQIVRVRYTQANGETTTGQFIGITARCIQHEIDHLDGVLFYNRASKFHRDQGMRKWRR